MNFAEYKQEVYNDAIEYIHERIDYIRESSFERFENDLMNTITGGYNGSYYCSSYKASKAVAECMFDYDFIDELTSCGFMDGLDSCHIADTILNPEYMDLVARETAYFIMRDAIADYFDEYCDEYCSDEDGEDCLD